MNSRTTPAFWKQYANLPREVRRQAVKAYRLWRENPNHPSLAFKRLRTTKPLYAVRVSLDYRVVGRLEGDTMIWYFIGTHDDYMRLLADR